MIAFETDVHINRPIQEVFAYVSDPLAFPRWNSAVQAVRRTSAAESGVHSTYLMERELPTGRAVNELEIVASEPPHEFLLVDPLEEYFSKPCSLPHGVSSSAWPIDAHHCCGA